jgi:NIMA (never in mitosis gene a)-related kinase
MSSAYETIRVLGRGSYGTAVLAREKPHAGCGQLRVLKEVNFSQMQPERCQEARKEVEVLRSLQHINIVAYYSTFVEFGRLYIVMEYADGGTLADAVRERQSNQMSRFTEQEALSIFAQSCLALQHMHAKHVLHRDLKSQNIFMTKDGVVKLGDFGIAKVLEDTDAEAMTVIGTPSYLAPEVCDSMPYGMKADVWSLGVVLYEILTLELPFKARSLAALVVKIVTGKPEPISSGTCSQASRSLVKRLLRKKPEQRLNVEEILAVPIVIQATAQLCKKLSSSDSEGSTRASSRNPSTDSASSQDTRLQVQERGQSTLAKVPERALLLLRKRRRAHSKHIQPDLAIRKINPQSRARSLDRSEEEGKEAALDITIAPSAQKLHDCKVLSAQSRPDCQQEGPELNAEATQMTLSAPASPLHDGGILAAWEDSDHDLPPKLPCIPAAKASRRCRPLPLPPSELKLTPHLSGTKSEPVASSRKSRLLANRPPRRLASLPQQQSEDLRRKACLQLQEASLSAPGKYIPRRPASTPPAAQRPRRLEKRSLSPLALRPVSTPGSSQPTCQTARRSVSPLAQIDNSLSRQLPHQQLPLTQI